MEKGVESTATMAMAKATASEVGDGESGVMMSAWSIDVCRVETGAKRTRLCLPPRSPECFSSCSLSLHLHSHSLPRVLLVLLCLKHPPNPLQHRKPLIPYARVALRAAFLLDSGGGFRRR